MSCVDKKKSKAVSASNVCLGNPVCIKYVRPSRSICGSKVCQSKPTSYSNIHHKPIRPNHICLLICQYQLNRYHLYFYLPI